MTKSEMDKWIKSLEHALYVAGTYEEPDMEIDENRMDGDNNENESE